MRKLALTLTVALVVGGCSSESEVAQSVAQTRVPSKVTPTPSSPLHAGRIAAFAAMPDHGTLLAYDRTQKPVHRGAQTYHAIQLSEAHALNAAVPGKSIELPMPSGGTMHIDYVRHEEGLDGNWSWVGKTADGLDAVITFGETAAFGRIAQRDTEALRLTMSAGRSWLVESDPSKMLDGNLGRDSDESDTLIPSGVVAAISAKKRTAVAAGDEAVSAANTIDVALGFTNGLVTKYGTVANANTRLANLVAITNQGYANSLVTPRIRLVRTVQVSYTDTNSNETALEAVTGYTCTASACTPQAVPTELVPLRTARDTYGADLVSLVRPFQAPQHQGCGIAWLLGGGGFTIDSTDAPFGYSVVSDGTDVDETDGRTYFCREETLAHELGHNMGQQHNIEDAGTPPDSGTHSYSYGYRETTTTGFYTVMAYRLGNSSQFSINYFGNPSVNYADTGRPTGSATADNARSLNLSMPLVAQFRNTIVPFVGSTRNDVNADGRSDLIWHQAQQGLLNVWFMNGTTISSSFAQAISPLCTPRAIGDLNGDGRADVVWVCSDSGVYLWQSTGSSFTQLFIGGFSNGWELVAAKDANGDGRDDLIWYNANGGLLNTWLMNGTTISSSFAQAISTLCAPKAFGDLNGDGKSDVAFMCSDSGVYLWQSTGSSYTQLFVSGFSGGWSIIAAKDANGDGRDDLIWHNAGAGLLNTWLMNGTTITGSWAQAISPLCTPSAFGDYDGDSRSDVTWVCSDSGVYQWRSTGSSYNQLFVGGFTPGWSPLKN